MMLRKRIQIAAALACLALAGCGSDRQAEGIVEIADEAITQSDFDRWLKPWAAVTPMARGQLVAPGFQACVGAARRAAGTEAAAATALRKECRSLYELALGQLIERRWLDHEAARLEVELDRKAVRANVRARYRQTVGSEAAANPEAAKLARRGLPFMRQQAQIELLTRQVRERLASREGEISQGDVERFYGRYPQRFAEPARRTVRVLAAPTHARTRRALQALRSGQGWRRLATALELDANVVTSKTGRVTLSEDLGDAALIEAVFSVRPGSVGGPVQTLSGRYVFAVDAASPRRLTRRAGQRAARLLLERRRDLRIQRAFNVRYIRETTCRRGYRGLRCGNR